MKNIILQHWSGELNELTKRSVTSISKYAKKIGVEHQLLQGDVFDPNFSPPCQKVHMLSEKFDDYDMVVMIDADMFTRKGIDRNVFTDTTGIGWHGPIQDRLVRNLKTRFPKLGNPKYPYWGGSIYRLDRDVRQLLRQHINKSELKTFNKRFVDEGIMHRLATLAKFEITDATYIPETCWNRGSYENDLEYAQFIHIRTRITPTGPKQPKMKNYKKLVKKGLIEE